MKTTQAPILRPNPCRPNPLPSTCSISTHRTDKFRLVPTSQLILYRDATIPALPCRLPSWQGVFQPYLARFLQQARRYISMLHASFHFLIPLEPCSFSIQFFLILNFQPTQEYLFQATKTTHRCTNKVVFSSVLLIFR